MLKKLFNIVVSLFATSAATAGVDEPVKVLFIGNSYTHMNEMPSIVESLAKEADLNVLIERNTRSGASFKVHTGRKDMFEAINSRKWDYVVLQGFSRELSHSPEHIEDNTVPYVNEILDSIYKNNLCTNVLFYMTWGYDDGFKKREEVDTYEKMADSIERGYRYLGDVYDLPVVPAGMVWKNVKQNSSIDLYDKDRAHPSINGSYLVANTFFESIFGRTAEGLETDHVGEREARIINRAVSEVLTEKRTFYKLDRNQFILESVESDEKGKYQIDFFANFPDAESIVWRFGESEETHIKDWSGRYYFDRPGKYEVKVDVMTTCGVRTYNRFLVIEARERRRRKKKREK